MADQQDENDQQQPKPEWLSVYEQLLAEGPALRSVQTVFKEVDEDLRQAFDADPVAAADDVLKYLAASQVSLMLRNHVGLRWALAEFDGAVGSKDGPLGPRQAVPLIDRLGGQLKSFLELMLTWGRVRHTMQLGKGRQ